jgi:hypothetical protein
VTGPVLSKGPNRVEFSLSSPEDGNRPSFQPGMFSSYLELRALYRAHKPRDSEVNCLSSCLCTTEGVTPQCFTSAVDGAANCTPLSLYSEGKRRLDPKARLDVAETTEIELAVEPVTRRYADRAVEVPNTLLCPSEFCLSQQIQID